MIDHDIMVMTGRIIGALLLIIGGIHLLAPIADLDPWRLMVLMGLFILLTSFAGPHEFIVLAAATALLLALVLRSVL